MFLKVVVNCAICVSLSKKAESLLNQLICTTYIVGHHIILNSKVRNSCFVNIKMSVLSCSQIKVRYE